MSTSGQPSSFASFNYQVFFCFRGTDVRNNFLECLHRRLTSYGIDAFRDKEGVGAGEPIIEKLLETIGDAQVCIPIFSKDFASSRSCLEEVEQMVALKKTIFPIFYGVEPDIVREQLNIDGESFHCHILHYPEEVLDKWRDALAVASRKKGEVLPDIERGYQDLIDRVVHCLREMLRMDHQDLPKHYVDDGHHAQAVLTKLGINYDECGRGLQGQHLLGKRIIDISGPRGIGKTTIAKVVYNSIRPLFRISGICFLHGVRGKVAQGILLSLQKKLICDLQGSSQNLDSLEEGAKFISRKFYNKAVLIILDDVDCFKQVERLLGGLDWLGEGSRVLLTSGKRDLINHFEALDRMVLRHEVGQLPADKAEVLFYRHAFRRDYPEEGLTDIARGITEQLLGIPHYIELVGSCLYGKDICNRRGLWQEMDEMLKVEHIGHVEKLVNPSPDNLDENTSHIFLDIACLFNGMDRAIPSLLWRACTKYPNWAIHNIWSFYWLDIGKNNVLQMPEQRVRYGKRKVTGEGSHPLKRSRIWDLADAKRALEDAEDENGRNVEALSLADDIQQPVRFSYPQLCFLSELRVLRLSRAKLHGSLPRIVHGKNRASRKSVLQKLRWLSWKGRVKVSFLRPLHAEYLVILDLSSSGISFMESTECWRKFFKGVKRLKVLDLSGCSGVSLVFLFPTCLERLNLDHCGSPFPKQSNSLRNLQNLVHLSIRHCQLGKELPSDLLELRSLAELVIDGTGIVTLPRDLVKQLEVLSASDCKDLERIPEFKESSRMRILCFKGCEKVHEVPESIGNLVCLEELDVSETMIRELPETFRCLQKLRVLRMRRTFMEEVPGVVNEMVNIKEKDFSECGSLRVRTEAAAAAYHV